MRLKEDEPELAHAPNKNQNFKRGYRNYDQWVDQAPNWQALPHLTEKVEIRSNSKSAVSLPVTSRV